jgi:Zn-dependent peptidase ImmA (M78 family)/transcriptional regulator with XRE-family HTH domain
MERVEATPTPALLIWARESAGMSVDVAAQKAAVKPDKLAEWENGISRPSVSQLRKLAGVYRRPLAAFYLAEPPRRFQVMHDFRRPSSSSVTPERSPTLAYEIRRAFDRREWALELTQSLDETPVVFSARADLGEDVEVVANRIREALSVNIRDQFNWASAYEAFNNWRLLVERAGILALQATSIQLSEARGFSISTQPLPVVVANIKDAPRGRIFTLIHELVHVMLAVGGICDLHDGDEEAFCNQVAGAALFPREALLSSPVVRQHAKGNPVWTDGELQELSRRFGGSREAALVRLLTLRLTTQTFYERMRTEFLRIYREQEAKRQEQEGFAPPHVVALSSAGRLFTSLVVENFNREKITASDVSDYLQIRVKHLKDLQADILKEA